MPEPVGPTKERSGPIDLGMILNELWAGIPKIARNLIWTELGWLEPANRPYYRNPDSPAEHNPDWHQWGVITHSQKFGEALLVQVPDHLTHWGLKDLVDQALAKEIDGVPKAHLLLLAAPLHDLGKFAKRQVSKEDGVVVGTNFAGHEAQSGQIVRSPEFTNRLISYGMYPSQVEYLARCAELHFELGKVRGQAKKFESGYSLKFVDSPEFQTAATAIMCQNPDMQPEIGLLFLADNLAKTELRIGADTDEQIAEQHHSIANALEKMGLDPRLIRAVAQGPVNLAVARRYLELWAASYSPEE